MSQRQKRIIYFILGLGALSAVALSQLSPNPWQSLGAFILAVGVAVVVLSRQLSAKGITEIDAKPLAGWSGPLRPFTLLLWGAGLAILGFIYLLGV